MNSALLFECRPCAKSPQYRHRSSKQKAKCRPRRARSNVSILDGGLAEVKAVWQGSWSHTPPGHRSRGYPRRFKEYDERHLSHVGADSSSENKLTEYLASEATKKCWRERPRRHIYTSAVLRPSERVCPLPESAICQRSDSRSPRSCMIDGVPELSAWDIFVRNEFSAYGT